MAQTKHPMKAQQSTPDIRRRKQGIRARRRTHQQSDSLLSNYHSAYKSIPKTYMHTSNPIPNEGALVLEFLLESVECQEALSSLL
jgi:DNA-binding ferritin-like protein (Dps family)